MRRRSTLRRVLPMQSEFCPVVVGRFGFQGCIAMGDRQRLHRWLTSCFGNGNHWSRRCDRATFRVFGPAYIETADTLQALARFRIKVARRGRAYLHHGGILVGAVVPVTSA